MSRTEHPTARRAASQAAHAARTAAGTTARTAVDHPRAAASGVGVGSLLAAVVAGLVLVRIVRSRRVQHLAATSAERGAFGPGVATATRVARRARAQR